MEIFLAKEELNKMIKLLIYIFQIMIYCGLTVGMSQDLHQGHLFLCSKPFLRNNMVTYQSLSFMANFTNLVMNLSKTAYKVFVITITYKLQIIT